MEWSRDNREEDAVRRSHGESQCEHQPASSCHHTASLCSFSITCTFTTLAPLLHKPTFAGPHRHSPAAPAHLTTLCNNHPLASSGAGSASHSSAYVHQPVLGGRVNSPSMHTPYVPRTPGGQRPSPVVGSAPSVMSAMSAVPSVSSIERSSLSARPNHSPSQFRHYLPRFPSGLWSATSCHCSDPARTTAPLITLTTGVNITDNHASLGLSLSPQQSFGGAAARGYVQPMGAPLYGLSPGVYPGIYSSTRYSPSTNSESSENERLPLTTHEETLDTHARVIEREQQRQRASAAQQLQSLAQTTLPTATPPGARVNLHLPPLQQPPPPSHDAHTQSELVLNMPPPPLQPPPPRQQPSPPPHDAHSGLNMAAGTSAFCPSLGARLNLQPPPLQPPPLQPPPPSLQQQPPSLQQQPPLWPPHGQRL